MDDGDSAEIWTFRNPEGSIGQDRLTLNSLYGTENISKWRKALEGEAWYRSAES